MALLGFGVCGNQDRVRNHDELRSFEPALGVWLHHVLARTILPSELALEPVPGSRCAQVHLMTCCDAVVWFCLCPCRQ